MVYIDCWTALIWWHSPKLMNCGFTKPKESLKNYSFTGTVRIQAIQPWREWTGIDCNLSPFAPPLPQAYFSLYLRTLLPFIASLPTSYLVTAAMETARPLMAPSLLKVTELLMKSIVDANAADTNIMNRNFIPHNITHSNQVLHTEKKTKKKNMMWSHDKFKCFLTATSMLVLFCCFI